MKEGHLVPETSWLACPNHSEERHYTLEQVAKQKRDAEAGIKKKGY